MGGNAVVVSWFRENVRCVPRPLTLEKKWECWLSSRGYIASAVWLTQDLISQTRLWVWPLRTSEIACLKNSSPKWPVGWTLYSTNSFTYQIHCSLTFCIVNLRLAYYLNSNKFNTTSREANDTKFPRLWSLLPAFNINMFQRVNWRFLEISIGAFSTGDKWTVQQTDGDSAMVDGPPLVMCQ